MQFFNTPLSTCDEEPFGNISACRHSMLPCSRFLEVKTYYSDYWPLRRYQETLWLLDEIQRQPSVYVLSCPATVITNISAACAFRADGWSTESVSRVVRSTRTRQENNERQRAEHVYYSHIHDEVTISDSSAVTGLGFEEDENLTKNTTAHG